MVVRARPNDRLELTKPAPAMELRSSTGCSADQEGSRADASCL